MSHMLPAFESLSNPDSRSLPQGWIQQYDTKYKAWFYVNMLVSPAVTQWTHPSEHVTPPPPSSPPPQYDPPDGPPNHDAYPNEKKSFDGSYKSSSFHGSRGEYEDYDSHPQRHQGGGYGGRHDGGQGGPWRGGSERATFDGQHDGGQGGPSRGAERETFGGLLRNLAEAKVNRHVQARKARWERKKAMFGLLAGSASLIGGAMTRSSSRNGEYNNGHRQGSNGDYIGNY